jgi:predicted ribosome quality control (RQC) complex YloA/Tae2 family protein
MLTHYYTLRYIASTLYPILGGKAVASVWSQRRDELILAFLGVSPHLVVTCATENPILYLHESVARARRNSIDLFPEVLGQNLEQIVVRGGDRTVEMRFGAGVSIRALLFGAQANVYLTGSDGIVLSAFRKTGHQPGQPIPPSREGDIIDLAGFRDRLASGGTATLSGAVKSSFPTLGTTLVQETCTRAGVAASTACAGLTDQQRVAVERSLVSLLGDVERPAPRVYCKPDGTPSIFSIVPLQSAVDLTEKPFDDVHAAVRFFLGRRHAAAGMRDDLSQLTRPIVQRLEKYRRTTAALETEISAASRADEYERNGALLLANLQAFRKGDRQVILSDDGVAVTITLDPSIPPVRNAQRYFDRAKKARTAIEEGTARLNSLRAAIARGEGLLSAIESCGSKDDLAACAAENESVLEEFGAGRKSKEKEELPFRVFTVDGGFEVWAGKSSANNDLLTLKYARPDDLWFHARGSSGSHVVLRVGTGKGEPGKKAREQSAAIAAFYSKMKTASMVPVAMCEKRYVRKPKGAPPGTVVIEREKVLFVEPALPETDQTS